MRSRKRTQGIHIGMSREREKRERDRQGRGVRRQAGGANRLWGGGTARIALAAKERDVVLRRPHSAANVRFLLLFVRDNRSRGRRAVLESPNWRVHGVQCAYV